MNRNGFQFYTGYLLGKRRHVYREIGRRYNTHSWVIYRLIHGTSIRSEKELDIYRRLMDENPGCQTGHRQ